MTNMVILFYIIRDVLCSNIVRKI